MESPPESTRDDAGDSQPGGRRGERDLDRRSGSGSGSNRSREREAGSKSGGARSPRSDDGEPTFGFGIDDVNPPVHAEPAAPKVRVRRVRERAPEPQAEKPARVDEPTRRDANRSSRDTRRSRDGRSSTPESRGGSRAPELPRGESQRDESRGGTSRRSERPMRFDSRGDASFEHVFDTHVEGAPLARSDRRDRPARRIQRESEPQPWQPTAAMRSESFVQMVRSSRCDERGALVVDVRIARREHLDPNALRVIGRLSHEGYEAYLVGGCVRDLLLGRRPKDFDVATEAHPREVKRMFRNGRIIGRRFKLVHVVYGPNVVETSTFRAPPRGLPSDGGEDPTVDDLLIIDDNEFGTAAEDARRRDFTINGLFLDPLAGEIIDYVDGLEDIAARVLRTIGDPRVRIAEDPVRILRAVKFSSRLGLTIHPDTWNAMVEHASGLARSAAPRVVEEIVRLLQSGHASQAFAYLEDCGALRVLLPELARWRNADRAAARVGWAVLSALDERIHGGDQTTTAFNLAALFAPAFMARLDRLDDGDTSTDGDALDMAGDLLEPLSQVARLSRRDVGLAKRLLANQRRFVQAPSRRFRPLLFIHSQEFEESLDLLALRARAGTCDAALVDEWRARQIETQGAAPEVIEQEVTQQRKRRRRRRRGGSDNA